MKKLVLHLPLAVGIASGLSSVVAPIASAATVTLNQVGGVNTCTYSAISTDANGNLTVTCTGATPAPPGPTPPAPGPTPPAPGPTSTPPPPTTPPSGNCPALPTNYKYINELGRPQGGGTLPRGQEMYDNPSTVVADGTIGTNQILIVPFKNTGTAGTSRAAILPGNYGGIGGFQMVLSKCPGSLAPADFADVNGLYCSTKGTTATAFFNAPYCRLEAGVDYYLNIKPVNTQDATSSFLFSFN
jgi:hypothetical protein